MLGELLEFAGLTLLIDQASKRLVTARIGFAPRPRFGLRPRFQPHLNRNIGLGVVNDPRALLLLWSLAVCGTALMISWTPSLQTWPALAGLGAAIGGATGNFIDCARFRAIVDFIDLRVWPIFNLADVAIVLGVGAALWSIH
jgi:lipoprotein signal peptidase